MYYEQHELVAALKKATHELDMRARWLGEYQRGFNDCFAFLALYDEYLSGKSRAFDKVDFHWNTTREFVGKLYKAGYTIPSYLEYCGFEIVKNKRPILGDVGFMNGAMISNGSSWVSTNEHNHGVMPYKQMFYYEHDMVIARPTRS